MLLVCFCRINASGGGCCDCGDSSSWKEEGTCTRHKPDAARPEPDITTMFSAAQLHLMRALMNELVRITSLAVGCSESGRLVQLWPVLFLQNKCVEMSITPPSPATHTHLCLLLNDDVHSFEQVVTQLQRAVGTSETEGNLLANSVHGCGRALAFVGSLSRATAVSRKLAEIGLGVEVHPVESYVLILQETRLQALMEWMADKAKLASFFLGMQGDALMQPRVLPQAYQARLEAVQEAQQAAAKAAAPSASVDASSAASADAASNAREPSRNSSVASGDAEFDMEYMRHLAAADLGGEEQPDESEGEEEEESENEFDEGNRHDSEESVDSRGHTAAERAEEAAFIAGEDRPMGDAPPADPLAAFPAAAAAAPRPAPAAAPAGAAAPTASVEDEVIVRILELLTANGATIDDLPPNLREPMRAHLRRQATEEERNARQEEEEEMALAAADHPEEEPEDLSDASIAKAMSPVAAVSSSSSSAAAASAPSAVSSSAVSPVLHIDSWLLNASFLSASLFKRLSGLIFTLFSSATWKLRYAHRFLRYFPTLVDQWCLFSGGLEHSSLDFAVQIFTIPAIALELTQAEPSAFRMFTATTLRYLQLHATRSAFPPYISCNGLSTAAQNPFSLLMNDLSYLLRCPSVPQWLWTQRPAETLASWSEVLAMQEGMDPNTLKKHVHVVHASNSWQHAFTLAIRTNNVSLQLLQAYSRMLQSGLPAEQLGSIARATLQQCELSLRRLWRAEKLRLKALQQSTSADASIQGVPLLPFSMRVVSFHTPLARFVSELLLLIFTRQNVVRIGAQQSEQHSMDDTGSAVWNPSVDLRVSKSESRKKGEAPFVLSSVPLYLHCIDSSARALALLGHIGAGLWVLNGESVANQRFNIERREVGTFFVRADLTAMQLAVAFTADQDRLRGPWCFVNVLLRRFGLGQYLQLSSDTSSASYTRALRTPLEWQQADKLFPVVESFMRYLLTILTDRERIGVVSRAARTRVHMLHKLLLKPCTFSSLAKCGEFVGEEEFGGESPQQQKLTPAEIKALVQSVADFSAGSTRSADSAGQYTLKPAALAEFNPYFFEYSSDQRQVAESNYLRLQSEADAKLASGKARGGSAASNHIYPPLLSLAPFVRPEFRALSQLILRPECSELCFRILRRYIGTAETAKPSTGDSKAAMQAVLFGYTAPPNAGNLRGTHERLVTHVVYLLTRGTEEARKELSEAEADDSESSPQKQERIDRVRGFLMALLRTYPAAHNQPASSLLTLLCQLNFTALSKRDNGTQQSKAATPSKTALKSAAPAAAAAASSNSSGAPSRVYSDWIFALQQPLMAHTIQQILQIDMQVVALDAAIAAAAPSSSSSASAIAAPSASAAAAAAYSSSSTLLRSIVSEYGVSLSASGDSAASSSDSSASDANREEDRAARLKRGLKIRRRITRDMRKKLEAAAAAFNVELPKKKSKASEASDAAAAGAEPSAKASADSSHRECIVCRASTAGQASGFITWMQPSTLHHLPLLTPPSAPFEPRQRVLTSPSDPTKATVLALSHRALPLQIAAADFAGDVRDRQPPVVVKSCNHLIHLACLDSYTASLWQKLNAGQAFEGMQCVDLNKGEFCCPLCRQLANCIVPAPLEAAITEPTPATATPLTSRPPVFQLTRAVVPAAGVSEAESEWIVRRAHLQQWITKSATNPMLMSQAAPRPPASLFPAHPSLRMQEGLFRSFAEQIAKQTSEQDRSAPKRTGSIDLFGQIRFLLGTLTATARGIELGARLSPHAVTMMRAVRKTPPISIHESLHTSDVLVLSAMLDGLALVLYGAKQPASGSSKPDALLKHVRSTWPSLVRLFAGDATAAAAPSEFVATESPSSSSSSDAMVDAGSDPTESAFLTALSAGAELRGNTPMVDRLRQLMGRISSGVNNVTSMRPHQLRHEDDESCLPQLSSRDLLQEDPFTLLVRCVLSQGYADVDSSATEIRHAIVLLWHLAVFQLATHFAFAVAHDNQHAYAAEVQQQVHAAWNGPGSNNQSASAVTAQAAVAPVESDSLTTSFQATIHALQLTRSLGSSSSSATAAASCVCCKPTWETAASFLLPFLRCCVVLFRSMNFLRAPAAPAIAAVKQSSSMSDVSESPSNGASPSPLLLEYRHLLSVLQLPDLDEVLSSDSPSIAPVLMQPLIAAFAALHPASVTPTLPLLTAYAPVSFVRLPLSYDGLFQSLSDPSSVCLQCGTAPKDPALCLVCGRLLCAKSSCCADSGRKELSHHTERCCPANGHYLLLRESSVVALSQGLMHSAGSCYADRENETDILLRRGKPLYRSEDRLENLRAQFAMQGAVTSYSQNTHKSCALRCSGALGSFSSSFVGLCCFSLCSLSSSGTPVHVRAWTEKCVLKR